ncbi:hypothetical protein J6590_074830 [Homalodisca vitripennis]|nr:hypothetical protein J6590_074830 [Homalodisca vitripennis]
MDTKSCFRAEVGLQIFDISQLNADLGVEWLKSSFPTQSFQSSVLTDVLVALKHKRRITMVKTNCAPSVLRARMTSDAICISHQESLRRHLQTQIS